MSWDDHDRDRKPSPDPRSAYAHPRFNCRECGELVFMLPSGVVQYDDATCNPHVCREPKPDPLLDSHIDIPIERMAREFRKRAGRAFGLGDDAEASDARTILKAIEDFDRKYANRK